MRGAMEEVLYEAGVDMVLNGCVICPFCLLTACHTLHPA